MEPSFDQFRTEREFIIEALIRSTDHLTHIAQEKPVSLEDGEPNTVDISLG